VTRKSWAPIPCWGNPNKKGIRKKGKRKGKREGKRKEGKRKRKIILYSSRMTCARQFSDAHQNSYWRHLFCILHAIVDDIVSSFHEFISILPSASHYFSIQVATYARPRHPLAFYPAPTIYYMLLAGGKY
jgi:hypothetical protein